MTPEQAAHDRIGAGVERRVGIGLVSLPTGFYGSSSSEPRQPPQ